MTQVVPLQGPELLQDALRKFKSIPLAPPPPQELALFHADYKWIPYLKPEYTLHPDPKDPDRALLGKGGFGSAYRVKSAKNPSEPIRVVKVLQKKFLTTPEEVQHLSSELAVAGFIHHENLNHRTGLFENDTHIFIILELCAGPRPDVLSRIAHVIARRRPDKIPQIEEIHELWKRQAETHGKDPNDAQEFGNFVDEARLMATLVPNTPKPEIPVASDLLNLIIPQGTLREPAAQVIMRQILLGLGHLHQCFVVHRDIKIDNVVIAVHRKCELKKDAAGKITSVLCTERFEVKIIDFGLVKYMNLNDTAFGKTVTPGGFIRAAQGSQEQVSLAGSTFKHEKSPDSLITPASSPEGIDKTGAGAAPAAPTAEFGAAAVFGNFGGFGTDLTKNIQQNKAKANADVRIATSNNNNNNIVLFDVSSTPGAGTVIYSSPEILSHVANNGSNKKVQTNNIDLPKFDVFGAGIILYCATQGKTPFQAPGDHRVSTHAHLVNQMQKALKFAPSTSELAKDLMLGMMKFDVKSRLNTADCLDHPYVRRVGDTVLTEFFPNPSSSWCKLERDIVRERREHEAEERKKAIEEAERQQKLNEEEEEKAKRRNSSNPLLGPASQQSTTTTTSFSDKTEDERAEEFWMQDQVLSWVLLEEDEGEKDGPHAVKPRTAAQDEVISGKKEEKEIEQQNQQQQSQSETKTEQKASEQIKIGNNSNNNNINNNTASVSKSPEPRKEQTSTAQQGKSEPKTKEGCSCSIQ